MRTLLTPRWLGLLLAALALAATMVFLGRWQLHRYEERSAINDRIHAGETGAAVPADRLLPRPADGPGSVGPALPDDAAWRRVTVTGTYDSAGELLVRNRTVDSTVGFEVITPLVTADGTTFLVDRGWIPPSPKGPTVAPSVPAAPTGSVTITARVHPSESGGTDTVQVDGRTEIRRVATGPVARFLDKYAVYDGYLLAVDGSPGATSQPIPVDDENAWQNAAYVVQWWLFAGLTLFGFGYLLRKEHLEGLAGTPTEASRTAAPVA
ncbi:SURF1 family cytochrome oxidase biogenesis protein [Hamadaea tsunoensis]|uniref:SURF1 family cytochrome oxidase biogenesis protein n=1 Tax=Hamadaea tsunoensis TaxID=53368 RepID=UPI0004103DDE|nr:SURF1 family protein [Hamadaea tsunoensis]